MADLVTQLYESHYLQLVRLARQFVDDVGSAEEAVQEVFVRLQRGNPAQTELGYPYLRTAVLNQCRSMLRHRAVVRNQHLPSDASRGGQALPDPATDVVVRDQIRSAIARLPRRQQEVVVLRFFEDLALREIATTLGISVNATSAALSRALKSIADQVAGVDR